MPAFEAGMSSTPTVTSSVVRLFEAITYAIPPPRLPNTQEDKPVFVVGRSTSLGKALQKSASFALTEIDEAHWAVGYDVIALLLGYATVLDPDSSLRDRTPARLPPPSTY